MGKNKNKVNRKPFVNNNEFQHGGSTGNLGSDQSSATNRSAPDPPISILTQEQAEEPTFTFQPNSSPGSSKQHSSEELRRNAEFLSEDPGSITQITTPQKAPPTSFLSAQNTPEFSVIEALRKERDERIQSAERYERRFEAFQSQASKDFSTIADKMTALGYKIAEIHEEMSKKSDSRQTQSSRNAISNMLHQSSRSRYPGTSITPPRDSTPDTTSSKKDSKKKGNTKKKYQESDSSSSSDSSESEKSSSTDQSDQDFNPVRTVFRSPETPTQVVSIHDVQDFQPGQDLHTYIQIYENSYCGSLPDNEKIFKFVNKLAGVPEVYQEALKMRKFNSWRYFKNSLLKEKGKKQKDILKDVRWLKIEKDEEIDVYFERLCTHLTQPAAKFSQPEIVKMIWGKMPTWVQDETVVYGDGKKTMKSLKQFRKAVRKLKADPLRKQIRDLDKKYRSIQNDSQDKSGGDKKYDKAKAPDKGKDYNKDSKDKNAKGKTSKAYLLNATTAESDTEEGESSEECDGIGFVTEFDTDFQVLAHEKEKRKLEEPISQNTRFGVNKRRAAEQPTRETLERIVEEEPEITPVTDTNAPRTNQPPRPETPMTSQTQQTFRNTAEAQPTKAQIDETIRELRMQQSSGKRYLLKREDFFDQNGNFDYGLAEESICQEVSLKQLRLWRDQQSKGQCTIYHAECETPNEIRQYFQQMQEQGVVAQDVFRVEGKGEHLFVDISIEGIPVKAIIDTGAQRTVISQSLAEGTELYKYVTEIETPFSLKGVTGKVSIISHLENVQIQFPNQKLRTTIPVISNCSFGMLLGQDILFQGLVNCAIQLQKSLLNYDVFLDGKWQTQCIQLQHEQQTGECEQFALSVADLEVENTLEDRFPKLTQIDTKYDLALVDLPIQYQAFHSSVIPYPTYPISHFEILGEFFKKIMQNNSVLLLWCSGKTLPSILQLITSWGYVFVNVLLVWVKLGKNSLPKVGLGYWSRNNCEFIVMARKGQHAFLRGARRDIGQSFFTLADQPEKVLHSSKPVKAYELLSQIFDFSNMKCLELFARVKQSEIQSQYFDLYGDEVPGYHKLCSPVDESSTILYTEGLFPDVYPGHIPHINTQDLELFKTFIQNLDMDQELKVNREVIYMLAKNFETFDCRGQVCRINNVDFRVRVKEGAFIPETRVPKLDKEKQEFVQNWIKQCLDKGYVEKGPVKCAFPPIVVAKKGPQKFRVCVNFQPLDEVLEVDPELELYKGDEAEDIIMQGKGSMLKCTLDCKEAHNGLPVPEEDREYLGIIVPGDGVYRSKVGQFGIKTVSKAYIKAMTLAIGWLREHGVYFYADDVAIFGKDFSHCLWLLDQTLSSLRKAGFIVSARKCKLFKQNMEILGQQVSPNEVSIAPNKVQSIQSFQLPRTKKQLQKFIGCVTYVRKFIPDVASYLTPLYDALKGPEFLQLNEVQQEVFEDLKELLVSHQVLRLPSFHQPFFLTLTFSKFGYGACLMQKDEKTLRPLFYRSKTRAPEQLKPQYLLQLEALEQALKDWRKIVYGQSITVITDSSLLKHTLAFTGDDVQINRLLMKIQAFRIQVAIKPESFKALRFSKLLAGEEDVRAQSHLEELLQDYEKDLFQRKLSRKEDAPEVPLHLHRNKINVFFDGACTRTKGSIPLGTYGLVALDSEGEIIHRESGRVISREKITNNVTESYGMLKAMQYLKEHQYKEFDSIQVLGDSELIIKQLKGIYRVNSDPLRTTHREIKKDLKTFKKLTLRHIPRELNQEANELAQNALRDEIKKDLDVLGVSAYAIHQPDLIESIICSACGKKGKTDEMYLCDHCGAGEHQECLGELAHPAGPAFYCRKCEHYVFIDQAFAKNDITKDASFLDFLQRPYGPRTQFEQNRCERLARYYALRDDELYFYDVDGVKRVPCLSERHHLTIQIHQSLGHCGMASTLRALKKSYYWPGMTADVHKLVQSCLFCQARRKTYLPMPQVYPTYKGLSIWQYVSVDLITVRTTDPELEAPRQEEELKGPQFVLSAICAYSKAPELIVLKDKKAETVKQAFQDQIVNRYGSPLVVRSDEGREFMGEFSTYLQTIRCRHITTGPRYPQGNGLIERLNQTIKQKLQAFANMEEFKETWVNLVQQVAFAIRVQRSRATGFSPFQIMYGRDPVLPGHFTGLAEDTFYEPSEQQVTAHIEKLRKAQKPQDEVIRRELDEMNKEIVETVEHREFKKLTNLQPGQVIMVRNKDRSTKMALEVEGPCYFVDYQDPTRKDVVTYFSPQSRQYKTTPICNIKIHQQ